jgi:polysaccharide export outer membrane protein
MNKTIAAIRIRAPLVALAMTLAACGGSPEVQLPGPPLTSPAAPSSSAYLLAPGDDVEIRFFSVPELDDRVTVRPDGRISLQLVNDVDAAGQTVEQLRQKLVEQYAGQLKEPIIDVVLRSLGQQHVYVDGEVQKPGEVASVEPITVAMAIAQAGGAREGAKTSDVVLIRRGYNSNPPQASVINLDAVQSGADLTQNIKLANFDVIYVPRKPVTDVNRWVDLYLRQNIPVIFGYTIP